MPCECWTGIQDESDPNASELEQQAWDCRTGNGQAARELPKHFNRVIATDASAAQIAQVVPDVRIDYRVEYTEEVNIAANKESKPPEFEIKADWELGQLAGFLESWSATQRYQNERGQHPLSTICQELAEVWGEPGQGRTIRWRIYIRVGRVR